LQLIIVLRLMFYVLNYSIFD